MTLLTGIREDTCIWVHLFAVVTNPPFYDSRFLLGTWHPRHFPNSFAVSFNYFFSSVECENEWTSNSLVKFIWITFPLPTAYSIVKHWLPISSADEDDTLTMTNQNCEMYLGPFLFSGAESSDSVIHLQTVMREKKIGFIYLKHWVFSFKI